MLEITEENAREKGVNPELSLRVNCNPVHSVGVCRDTEAKAGKEKKGKYPGHRGKGIGAARREFQEDQKENRQEQVKVFLDSERPSVIPDVRAIILNEKAFIEQSWVRVVSGKKRGAGQGHHHVKRRIDFEAATDPESLYLKGSCALVFIEQQAGNQVAGEYEEEINTGPAEIKENPNAAEVVKHHEQYGDAAQDVESLISWLHIVLLHHQMRRRLTKGRRKDNRW
ncbi:MAG TPA: hypothetical protein VFQ24_15145 [Terriglobia bacterium]|nr:hypothetical protein [Terriglobia bacterium]